MERFKIISLVDITRSNCSRSETNKIKIGQQANFNSLVQAIGLRSNLEWDTDPQLNSGSLPHPLNGKAKHWIWEFFVERDSVFLDQGDPVGLLVNDLNGVPVIDQLNNSIEIDPCCFITRGENINIWVYKIS
jgi:hypothetical protein